jgi:hypothetical protein
MEPPRVLRASRTTVMQDYSAKTERLPLQRYERPQHERITETPSVLRSSQFRMILSVIGGMLAALFIIGIANTIGGYALDQWRYGDGRVTRLEAVVGHHDDQQHPTELLALESHGQIDVIELPGNNSEHTQVYHIGQLLTQQAGHAIVTLSIKDVNRDGLLDVLVTVQGEHSQALYNNGATFQTTSPTKG